MSIQKDYFLTQLITLRPTEEHLKAFSLYLKAYEDTPITIRDGIEFVHSRSSIHHRITLYYLINELLNLKISDGLRSELLSFIRQSFHSDVQQSQSFEMLNKRLRELEKIWGNRKLVDFGEKEEIEVVVERIKEVFHDKKKLSRLFKELLEEYEEREVSK